MLPAAIGASLAAQLLVGIVSEWETVIPLSSAVRDFISQAVNTVVAPLAFVYAGAQLAPSHRFATSAVLAGIFVAVAVALSLYRVSVSLEASRVASAWQIWWPVFSAGIGAVVAAATSYKFYLDEQVPEAP